MGNTTKGIQEDLHHIITRDLVGKVKPASPEKQRAFNILNKWQGKTHYLLAVKIEQEKLINGLK